MLIVMMFCGDEMGEVKPPIQLAKAIPRIRQGPTVELGGSVRRIGYSENVVVKREGRERENIHLFLISTYFYQRST